MVMLYIGIIGGSRCTEITCERAREMGTLIAKEGWVLICGGMGGVMEAACKGAFTSGGVTIGILPGGSRGEGNSYLSYRIVTGMGHMRNALVVRSSDIIVAFEGSYGTLSEIAFANIESIPIIGFHSWRIDPKMNEGASIYTREAHTPAEAILMIKELTRVR
jgi:uncharacterized protein (TIGR00725 family)